MTIGGIAVDRIAKIADAAKKRAGGPRLSDRPYLMAIDELGKMAKEPPRANEGDFTGAFGRWATQHEVAKENTRPVDLDHWATETNKMIGGLNLTRRPVQVAPVELRAPRIEATVDDNMFDTAPPDLQYVQIGDDDDNVQS